MESYEKLLNEAYDKVKVVEVESGRFEIPKVEGMVAGKNTIITNIMAIASSLRRPDDQLARFLQKELAVYGKFEGDRLIFNSKINSAKVNDKIVEYANVFVICNECKKPDTEIVVEKGLKFKHCLACGAKSPVKG